MRVTLPKDYRNYFTLHDLDIAKRLIACAKEDEATAKEYAEMAVRAALRGKHDFFKEVLKASAEVGFYYRTWDRYFDGSEHMDIYISAIAETDFGFVKIGAMLSDIWDIDGTTELFKGDMYIRYYAEDKEVFNA